MRKAVLFMASVALLLAVCGACYAHTEYDDKTLVRAELFGGRGNGGDSAFLYAHV